MTKIRVETGVGLKVSMLRTSFQHVVRSTTTAIEEDLYQILSLRTLSFQLWRLRAAGKVAMTSFWIAC
jgi:hypothetical protein